MNHQRKKLYFFDKLALDAQMQVLSNDVTFCSDAQTSGFVRQQWRQRSGHVPLAMLTLVTVSRSYANTSLQVHFIRYKDSFIQYITRIWLLAQLLYFVVAWFPSIQVHRNVIRSLIARFMGPTWGPSGADRTQVGPMLAPWTLLSGFTPLPFAMIKLPTLTPFEQHFQHKVLIMVLCV